jgi:sec-independent protein translocase protein TatB
MKIGVQELLIVFIVALVVVGPDKLPYYAKKLGEAFGQFRKYTDQATKDIRESIVEPLEEAQKPLREAMEPVNELEKSVRDNVKGIQKSINDIGKPRKEDTPAPDAASQEPEQTPAETEAVVDEQAPAEHHSPETEVQPASDEATAPEHETAAQDLTAPSEEPDVSAVETA